MVDHDIILAKAGSVHKHIDRIKEKISVDQESFLNDPDRQDIISFNIQMAVQNSIDIAAHIISEEGWGVPGSNNEMFYTLEDKGILKRDIVEKMVKAVGFRNLIVHEYGKLDLKLVYQVASRDIDDIIQYITEVITAIGIKPT